MTSKTSIRPTLLNGYRTHSTLPVKIATTNSYDVARNRAATATNLNRLYTVRPANPSEPLKHYGDDCPGCKGRRSRSSDSITPTSGLGARAGTHRAERPARLPLTALRVMIADLARQPIAAFLRFNRRI